MCTVRYVLCFVVLWNTDKFTYIIQGYFTGIRAIYADRMTHKDPFLWRTETDIWVWLSFIWFVSSHSDPNFSCGLTFRRWSYGMDDQYVYLYIYIYIYIVLPDMEHIKPLGFMLPLQLELAMVLLLILSDFYLTCLCYNNKIYFKSIVYDISVGHIFN